nr:MAG TPA: major capsid protein [Bacteriophage sp.]
MAINTLAAATLFMRQLDKIAVQDAVTGWMDANSGQVIYNGGDEVKIPKMSVQGLGDYDRDTGYVQGGVTLSYETRKMTQDRGRKFQLDPMDINENNFISTAAAVMAEFQRVHVIPEIDAYRISKIASETITADKAGMIEYGYTPGAASTSALRKLKEGIKAIRNLYNGPLVCHATPDFIMELELELAGKITAVTFARGGINTSVPAVDGVPIVSTPSNRMYTAITLYDGKTSSQEAGGYVKGSNAKDINFFICPRTTPIAVTKQDVMRIFDPNINQSLNAWQLDYRRFHDLWVLDNKLDSIFLNIKDTKE